MRVPLLGSIETFSPRQHFRFHFLSLSQACNNIAILIPAFADKESKAPCCFKVLWFLLVGDRNCSYWPCVFSKRQLLFRIAPIRSGLIGPAKNDSFSLLTNTCSYTGLVVAYSSKETRTSGRHHLELKRGATKKNESPLRHMILHGIWIYDHIVIHILFFTSFSNFFPFVHPIRPY